MINIKNLIHHVFNLYIWLGIALLVVLAGVLIGVFIKNPYWLAIDSCLDMGNVWDDSEKRCRDDCLTWNKEFGCIELTAEQVQMFKNCQTHIRYCIPRHVYKDICFYNQKAWNLDKEECRYDFKPEDCHKLPGCWQYPDICAKE